MWLRHAPAAWRPNAMAASQQSWHRSFGCKPHWGLHRLTRPRNPPPGFTPSQKKHIFAPNDTKCTFCSRAMHNSKCRYGERGAADAESQKRKILWCKAPPVADAAKKGQRSQSARGFLPQRTLGCRNPTLSSIWQRRCRAAHRAAAKGASGRRLRQLGTEIRRTVLKKQEAGELCGVALKVSASSAHVRRC